MSITLDGSNVSTVGVINSGTAVASTSGTSVIFSGIPAGVKRVQLIYSGVVTSGTSVLIVQLGTSSGFTTSGYLGSAGGVLTATVATSQQNSTGFCLDPWTGANVRYGIATFDLLTGNTWVMACSGGITGSAGFVAGGGSIALSTTLTQLQLKATNGTDTFTAGSVNIFYE